MSFDQNMIIDATTGSIARFVNHSCSPNCRMIKWIVGGQPRMALFAGDRPIMTGEELTYDYNFDPFSAKNVQKCLCGAENCRGVLGPKPREVKAPKVAVPSKEETKKASAKTAKRKLQLLEQDDDDVYDVEKASAKSVKKRKIAIATGAASSLSRSGLKVAKGAATVIKRSISSISVSTKAALTSKKTSSPLRRVSTGGIVKKASPKKAATATEKAKITTTKAALSALISSGGLPVKKAPKLAQASRSSSASLTIVAAPPKPKGKVALSTTTGNAKTKPKTSPSSLKAKTPSKTPFKTPSKRTPAKKASKAKHSGYTPPSSPGPDATPLKLSARKKVPTRKVLETKVAGTASVTKPKAKPKAKAKSKLAAVAKKSGFMAAVRKAVKSTVSAVEDKGKGKGTDKDKDESPAAEGSIEAVPARSPAAAAARAASPERDMAPRDSPEREPRGAMDVQRANSQIRLVVEG
jgi:histone-lysine N-methyltransferase ASH1L